MKTELVATLKRTAAKILAELEKRWEPVLINGAWKTQRLRAGVLLSKSRPQGGQEQRTHHLRFLRKLAVLAMLAVVYFLAAKLGLRLAYVHPSATAVWPPT